MIIKQEQFIPKDTVETTIDLLIRNLTTIKDNTGEFLLDFDGLKVDNSDKKEARHAFTYRAFVMFREFSLAF